MTTALSTEVIHTPRMTEREARVAGSTSNRLCTFRGMLKQGIRGGSIAVTTGNGNQSHTLTTDEVEALVSLMIERDEALLVGLDIELER